MIIISIGPEQRSYQRSLNEALYVLQTYFKSVCSLFLIYIYFLKKFLIFFLALYYVTFQCGRSNIFKKSLNFIFAHYKLKKLPKKVACLLKAFGSFFLCSPDCPNSPELHFCFINYLIRPSLVGSLVLKLPNRTGIAIVGPNCSKPMNLSQSYLSSETIMLSRASLLLLPLILFEGGIFLANWQILWLRFTLDNLKHHPSTN